MTTWKPKSNKTSYILLIYNGTHPHYIGDKWGTVRNDGTKTKTDGESIKSHCSKFSVEYLEFKELRWPHPSSFSFWNIYNSLLGWFHFMGGVLFGKCLTNSGISNIFGSPLTPRLHLHNFMQGCLSLISYWFQTHHMLPDLSISLHWYHKGRINDSKASTTWIILPNLTWKLEMDPWLFELYFKPLL